MPQSEQRVTDPAALHALAHPLRIRLLAALRLDGPATASELARRFSESSGSTSYHLRQLARYGFVDEDPVQPSRRERRWRATHQLTSWADADVAADPAGYEAAQWIHRHQLARQEQAAETFQAEVRSGQWSTDWVNAATQSDRISRLTAAALGEFVERTEALLEEYEARCSGAPDTERVALYYAAYPFRSP
jgi:DNA-binding transcriptional ArsR family regulator